MQRGRGGLVAGMAHTPSKLDSIEVLPPSGGRDELFSDLDVELPESELAALPGPVSSPLDVEGEDTAEGRNAGVPTTPGGLPLFCC